MTQEEIVAQREFLIRLRQVTPRVWVTPLLMAANIIVYGLMVARGVDWMKPTIADLLTWGANYAPLTGGGQWWRLGSSMFLHIGLIHIAMNMFVLYSIGFYVERLLGNLAFLVAYVLAGLAGGILSMAWHPTNVSAGASGAIFGLYGVLFAFLLRHASSMPVAIRNRLLSSGAIFVVYNIGYGGFHSNIDMGAHLGGLAGGFLAGLMVAVPLDVVGAARTRRAIIAGVVGLAALGGVALALPHTDDFQSEFERAGEIEKTFNEGYNAALADLNAHKLSDAEFMGRLTSLLPPWHDEIGRVAGLHVSGHTAVIRDKTVAYMQAREDELSFMIHADPTTDPTVEEHLKEKSAAREQASEELGQVLKGDGDPRPPIP